MSATASEGKQTGLWACELIPSKPGTVYGDLHESQAEAQGSLRSAACLAALFSLSPHYASLIAGSILRRKRADKRG